MHSRYVALLPPAACAPTANHRRIADTRRSMLRIESVSASLFGLTEDGTPIAPPARVVQVLSPRCWVAHTARSTLLTAQPAALPSGRRGGTAGPSAGDHSSD